MLGLGVFPTNSGHTHLSVADAASGKFLEPSYQRYMINQYQSTMVNQSTSTNQHHGKWKKSTDPMGESHRN
jgi:hypothetical protein